MITKSLKKSAIISVIGMLLILGTGGIVNAQKRSQSNRQMPQSKNYQPNQQRQQIYHQQQTQNQQRFEQRQQIYQQYQQQRELHQQQDQQQKQIQNQQQRVEQRRPDQQQHQQIQNQPRQQASQQKDLQFEQRQINQSERLQIQSQQRQWHQSEQNWQNKYNLRWQNQQNLFNQREQLLREQNRMEHFAFQQAYWERVREDQLRLQNWRFYNDVVLNYSYLRGRHYYYTSEYGMNMLRDAVNDGYQEGLLAGQSDREDGWKYDYRDAFAYQDATYGYNGYWVNLDEYQYYFRQGFQRGYEDGYYNRYNYGSYTNGSYLMLDGTLKGIINFSFIAG